MFIKFPIRDFPKNISDAVNNLKPPLGGLLITFALLHNVLLLKIMGRKKIAIGKKLLEKLYLKQNLSPNKIGSILNCSFSTISNRLKEFNIPLKTPALARMKYFKVDFDGNEILKAYMLGFRLGDLNVYKRSKNSETIVARCHTTQIEQVKILEALFNNFGHVGVSNNKGHFNANCYLNNSFNFLLSKNKYSWTRFINKPELAAPFMAGYTDAEGNFIINQGRARFKIDSYDFSILSWISNWLTTQSISNKFRLIYKVGDKWNGRYPLNKDLWRLNINEANSLGRFIELVMPYSKHKRRISGARVCLKNINNRTKNGTIKYT